MKLLAEVMALGVSIIMRLLPFIIGGLVIMAVAKLIWLLIGS